MVCAATARTVCQARGDCLGFGTVSTRVQLSREYPYGVPAFAAALADPEFHRVKLDVDGSGGIEVLDFRHDRSEDDTPAAVTVSLRQPVPPGHVPAAVEQLLRGRLVIERTEHWTLSPTGCRGRTEVSVPMTPISADGAMAVRPTEGGARLTVDLRVNATVPLLGGGIERAVVTGIRKLTGKEHERISTWLSRPAQSGR